MGEHSGEQGGMTGAKALGIDPPNPKNFVKSLPQLHINAEESPQEPAVSKLLQERESGKYKNMQRVRLEDAVQLFTPEEWSLVEDTIIHSLGEANPTDWEENDNTFFTLLRPTVSGSDEIARVWGEVTDNETGLGGAAIMRFVKVRGDDSTGSVESDFSLSNSTSNEPSFYEKTTLRTILTSGLMPNELRDIEHIIRDALLVETAPGEVRLAGDNPESGFFVKTNAAGMLTLVAQGPAWFENKKVLAMSQVIPVVNSHGGLDIDTMYDIRPLTTT